MVAVLYHGVLTILVRALERPLQVQLALAVLQLEVELMFSNSLYVFKLYTTLTIRLVLVRSSSTLG